MKKKDNRKNKSLTEWERLSGLDYWFRQQDDRREEEARDRREKRRERRLLLLERWLVITASAIAVGTWLWQTVKSWFD